MKESWLEEAVQSATGNISQYDEFEAEVFSVFKKYRDNGYPDGIIVSLVCDGTKMPMAIPAMFDKWRSQNVS